MNSGFVKIVISMFYLSLLMAYVTLAEDTTSTATPGTTPKADSAATTASGAKTGTESTGTSSGTRSTILSTLTTAKNDSNPTTAKPLTTTKSAGIRITGTEAALAMLVCVVYSML